MIQEMSNHQMAQKITNQQRIQQRQSSFDNRVNKAVEFNRILDSVQVKSTLKLSGHAEERLKERNITLSDKDYEALNNAAEKIRTKGGREALILYRDIAFITSVKNNTIITAVDGENLKENIFTNIDSACII